MIWYTCQMKTAYSIDQIQTFLNAHYRNEVQSIEPLKGGDWSSAYAFQLDGEDYVVRFGKYGDDFKKDQVAAEFASEHLPIPNVSAVGDAFDGYFAISSRAYGEMLDELDKASMERIVPAVFRMFDAMRAVDLSSTTGFGDWVAQNVAPYKSWSDYLLDVKNDNDPYRRIYGWRTYLENSPTGIDPFNKAYERLLKLVPASPNKRHLVHNDLLYRNVLVSNDKIAAVIDWGNSMYGDFLYAALRAEYPGFSRG